MSMATLPCPDPLFDDQREHRGRTEPALPHRHRVVLEIKVRRAKADDERIEISESALPPWVQLAVQRLRTVADLPPGWSGAGGPPVESRLFPRAFELIHELMPEGGNPSYVPYIVPTVDGGLQLEWHRDGFDLEIEISSAGDVWVEHSRLDGTEAWEGDYDDWHDFAAKVLMRAADEQ